LNDQNQKISNIRNLSGIFLLALAIRLAYLFEYSHSPLFENPQVDAQTYVKLARQIAAGTFFQTNTLSFYQPPLYPFLLAFFFKCGATRLLAFHLFQMVLGAVNCSLIYWLGRQVFNKKVGRFAGILAAVYWPLIYFDGELLVPTIFIFFALCLLICLANYFDRQSRFWLVLAGVSLGLSAISLPNILLFGWLVCPVFIFLSDKKSLRHAWKPVLFFLLSSIILILPVTGYNFLKDRAFVLVSHNGGLNFYIGNSPPEARLIQLRPGEAWETFTATPKRENPAKEFSGADFSGYWYRKSWHEFRQQPGSFFQNFGVKFIQFWHGYEFKRNLDVYFFKNQNSRLLRLPLPEFGWIAPLGCLGLFLSRKMGRKSGLLQAFVFTSCFSVILFFVAARYRLPIAPILMIFGGLAFNHLFEMLRHRNIPWKEISLLVLFFILVNWDFARLRPTPADLQASAAESWYFLARARGDLVYPEKEIPDFLPALALLEKATTRDPNFAEPHILAANYWVKLAKQRLRQTTLLNPALPDSVAAPFLSAENHLRRAAQIDSNLTAPVYNLCLLLYDLNIIDFNFYDRGSGRLYDNIFARAAEIDQLTDRLLQSQQFQKYEKFQTIKEKARLQLLEYQKVLRKPFLEK
jgi:4-amino-4-deoxy-L-arabinose transferase-like glycosyltransferase